jgi:hypothetical protein
VRDAGNSYLTAEGVDADSESPIQDKADYQIVRPGFAIPFAYYEAQIKDTGIDLLIKDTHCCPVNFHSTAI